MLAALALLLLLLLFMLTNPPECGVCNEQAWEWAGKPTTAGFGPVLLADKVCDVAPVDRSGRSCRHKQSTEHGQNAEPSSAARSPAQCTPVCAAVSVEQHHNDDDDDGSQFTCLPTGQLHSCNGTPQIGANGCRSPTSNPVSMAARHEDMAQIRRAWAQGLVLVVHPRCPPKVDCPGGGFVQCDAATEASDRTT